MKKIFADDIVKQPFQNADGMMDEEMLILNDTSETFTNADGNTVVVNNQIRYLDVSRNPIPLNAFTGTGIRFVQKVNPYQTYNPINSSGQQIYQFGLPTQPSGIIINPNLTGNSYNYRKNGAFFEIPITKNAQDMVTKTLLINMSLVGDNMIVAKYFG